LDAIAAPTVRSTTPMLAAPTAAETQTAYAKQLAEIPELAEYGPVSNSSAKPVQLTEPETEYQVSCVKHIFKEHVVFQVLPPASLIDVWPERANTAVQFNVSNTITDTVLEQVSVIVQPSEDAGLTEDFIIPVPAVTAATSPGIVYVSFTRDSPDSFAMGSFQCGMKFVSKEIDPSTGEPEEEGFEDEYSLEEVELSAADYIVPSYASFQSEWDRLTEATATETFALSAMESVKGRSHFWSVGSCVTLTVRQLRAIPSWRSSTWSRWAALRTPRPRRCTRCSSRVSSPAALVRSLSAAE
jgi:coatomer protein complex subunit gamma